VKPLNVEHLMMDASLLLPVTATPLTGIEFSKRLACGEVEHTQRVRVTFNFLQHEEQQMHVISLTALSTFLQSCAVKD
jgi:hypothetical protein